MAFRCVIMSVSAHAEDVIKLRLMCDRNNYFKA